MPEGSVLLAGNKMCAADSSKVMQFTVKLLASISLSIHQAETTANLLGWQGPR